MFDIGFLELAIIFIITLVVVGPDRLPDAVKSGVRFVTKFKRFMTQAKKDIETQIGADEIRRELHNEEVLKSIESFKSVQKELQEQKQALEQRLADDPTKGTDENAFADPGLAHPVETLADHPVETETDHAKRRSDELAVESDSEQDAHTENNAAKTTYDK